MENALSGMSWSLLRRCVDLGGRRIIKKKRNIEVKIDRILVLPDVFMGMKHGRTF
jgi:hypothetical protein